MKKILFVFTIVLLTLNSFGQEGANNAMSGTTLTNAVANASDSTRALTGNYIVTLEATFTQASGTTAGKAYLSGSVNGGTSKWARVTYTEGETIFHASDSSKVARQGSEFTLADALHISVTVKSSPYRYYKWSYAPSGTQSTTVEERYTFKTIK